ncbi:hypothetical protein BT69DRAFT_1284048 [Atractiella rhizophila]|nr:hypothetical protein BT69DRAFT_1284048 [Atractiella rhizophila]
MDLFAPRVASQPAAYQVESDSEESEFEDEAGLRLHPRRSHRKEEAKIEVEFEGEKGRKVEVGFGFEKEERGERVGRVLIDGEEIGQIHSHASTNTLTLHIPPTLPLPTLWSLSTALLSTLSPSSLLLLLPHSTTAYLRTSPSSPPIPKTSPRPAPPLQPPTLLTGAPAALMALANAHGVECTAVCVQRGSAVPPGMVDYGLSAEGGEGEVEGWKAVKVRKDKGRKDRGDSGMYI